MVVKIYECTIENDLTKKREKWKKKNESSFHNNLIHQQVVDKLNKATYESIKIRKITIVNGTQV